MQKFKYPGYSWFLPGGKVALLDRGAAPQGRGTSIHMANLLRTANPVDTAE